VKAAAAELMTAMFRVCKSMEEALQKRVSPSELKEIDSKIMLVRRSCTWSHHRGSTTFQ
jgi:hypothetical protein